MLERMRQEILLQEEQEFNNLALEYMLSENTIDDDIDAMLDADIEDEELLDVTNVDTVVEGDETDDDFIDELLAESHDQFMEALIMESSDSYYAEQDPDHEGVNDNTFGVPETETFGESTEITSFFDESALL